MKKYKFVFLAFLLAILLCSGAKSASAFVDGCNGTSGYSSATGESCSVFPGCSSHIGFSSTTGESCSLSTYPAGCLSSQGFSPTTGESCNTSNFPPGCTSAIGYSPTTGGSCSGSSFPPGCTSTQGYSSTTGNACNGTLPPQPVYLPGCTATFGYSSTTGQACDGTHPVQTSIMTITTPFSLPDAQVGGQYELFLAVSGVPSGFTTNNLDWKVSSGTLPPGLHLSASDSGEIILGTPTLAGRYDFSLDATTAAISQYSNVGLTSTSSNFHLNVAETPISITHTACSQGFDPTNGFRCGCSSTAGYSSTTGEACDGTTQYSMPTYISLPTYPPGCSSTSGFSSRDGEPCNVPALPATGSCTITGILQIGSTGDAVVCLQRRLGVTADGKFGPLTEDAVVAFQEKAGLAADGVVGPISISALGK